LLSLLESNQYTTIEKVKTLRIHVGITSFRKIIGFLSFPHPFEMYQSMQVS